MTKVVFITQQVDPEHPALAATVPKLRALARARRRGRGARGRRRRGRSARELPHSHIPRQSQGRSRHPIRGGAHARASRPPRRRRRRAHVSHLCRSCGTPRATSRRSARPLVHALAGEPTPACRRACLDGGGDGGRSFLPARIAKGARNRARHRPLGVRVRSRPRRRGPPTSWRSAATRPPRASTSCSVPSPRPAWTSRSTCTDHRSPRRSAPTACELERLGRRARARRSAWCSATRCREPRSRRSSPRTTRSSTTCAPERPTRSSTRLRRDACRCSRRIPCSTRCSTASSASQRDDPAALAGRIHAGRHEPKRPRRDRPPSPRAGRGGPLGAVVGAWHPRRGGNHVTDGVVLHTPEGRGHLRLGGPSAPAPPRPSRPGVGRPLPDAARGRAGRRGSSQTSSALAACRWTASGFERTSTRSRSAQVVAYLSRTRPRILHTHLVHADVYGQLAGSPRPRAVPALDEARVQRVSRGPVVRVRGSLRRLAGARPHRDLRRASPGTSRRRRGSTRETSRSSTTASQLTVRAAPYASDEPRLLCVGRLIPIKGHVVLLRALAQAREPRTGRDARHRRATARSSPRSSRMRASSGSAMRSASSASSRRCRQAIEDAAIVVVPSLGEGFGMVALEAMERARPVIASAVGGLPEIVADGDTGLVVPSADADALAEAIVGARRTISPAHRRWASAGRERALVEFTQERCTERIEALYATALCGAPERSGAAAGAAPRSRRARTRRGARAGSPTARDSALCPRRPSRMSVL